MRKIDIKLNKVKVLCETEGCSKNAIHHHHIYSDSKEARKLYGSMVDDDRNIILLCEDCHNWKPLLKYTEWEFCEALGIEPRSKVARGKARFG